MSRRHDSLKRAEQDQQVLQAVETESNGAPSLETEPFPGASKVPPQRASHLSAVSSPDDLDSSLAQCTRVTWKPDTESMIFCGPSEQTASTEELRALRSRLYRIRESQPLKSLLITSALPKEGKSFIAGNLAHVLALQPESRVLLIDGDMRNPRLHVMLGTSVTPGLSEYLQCRVEPFEAMQKGSPENLFFVPSGRSVAGPTELLANGHLGSLLKQVEPLFDWIIVDSPPANPVSDAALLGSNCDAVILVVRSASTPFDIVRKARERFRENQLVGVVLNTVMVNGSRFRGTTS